MKDKCDTRSKLIEVAKTIFAEKGYKETSIRTIAQAAGANLNAVNYHFENKRKLYLEVIHASKRDLTLKVDKLIETDVLTHQQFVVKLYGLFKECAPEFINNIKIHLDQTLSFQEIHESLNINDSCEAGPPGFNSFLKVLDAQFGDKLPTKGKIWIARSCIIHVFHLSILFAQKCNTEYVKKHLPKEFHMEPEESLTMNADALIEYVLKNTERFSITT